MKKLIKISLVTLIIFILSCTVVTAYAADTTVAVSSTPFQVHQGETFSTTIYIPDNANIVDFDITLKYNPDLITLNSVEENEDIKGTIIFNAETEGIIKMNYTRTSTNVNSYLPILDLNFSVKDDIGIGVYDCFTVDKTQTYVAHRLNKSGVLEKVDFSCDFSELIIYEMGDVDLSCTVDIGDATYIRRHLARFEGAILSDFKLSLADTYSDDIVDIADAVCLQRHLARLDIVYGNRVNIIFYNNDGTKYLAKSVSYNGTLSNIPNVPSEEGLVGGVWSLSATEYIKPDFSNLTKDVSIYAYYDSNDQTTTALEYYKAYLTDKFYSGDLPTNMNSDLDLIDTINYQKGYYASLVYSSDCNYVLNQTTGEFTKPTYPQKVTMSIKIISYDADNAIEGEDTINFTYDVPGMFVTPTKAEIKKWLTNYFTDDTDGKYRVNFDVNLISNINNEVIPTSGGRYDDYEVRLDWFQNIDGKLVPISKIERTTSSQINDYVAVATFNGEPLENDGKIYIDNVEVTAIEQIEIRNHIINQIAANMGTLATDGTKLWNNDTVYDANVTWETGDPTIAYVADNQIKLKSDAVSGSILPLTARVSYAVDGGAEEFILSYNLTVSCDNTKIKYPENMDEGLYKAIKSELEEELGYRGDLTSAALASVKFVNLDLSDYPDITSLRGLSYCVNLRTLNISGLKITDGTMNQISTLSYLEAFIARGCGLDNLSDGGSPTLKNAINLRLIDLTNNNFTSLDSVFAEGVKYGKLREVYLTDNKLTDINALSRAPLMDYLSLANNGLTTEDTACLANYPILSYLSIANNNIDSVEHLKGLRFLTELRLHNNNISNVNDLRRLVHLEALYLGNNKIKDIGFLNTLTKLKVLYVNDNQISDISNLTALAELEAVNLNNNKISSLSVLNNYKSTLTEIYAENNQLTDFSFINGASELHILMLSGNKLDIIQNNMASWLGNLTKMQVLTLSDIKLNDLSFLSGMEKLARLDIANCGLSAYTGETSNIEYIANLYATLKILDISNNDMSGYEEEILKLRSVSLLTVLYADNICDKLDAYTLTYSMPELKFISLENCGIDTIKWLSKYNNLAYVDLANNNISSVNIDSDISNASIKTLEELYLDTNVSCSFTNAYRITDFNVEKLSLAGISVDKVENLPYLDNIKYLNLSDTGLTNLTGDDAELIDMYSVERYATVDTIDVSGLDTDISILENIDSLNTVYAVGAVDSKLFYKDNLHSLQRMYNKGVTCYLYDKETVYEPTATKEGKDILNLIDDFSCDVTVAADNVISDNNPFLVSEINDYDITWSVSNSDNYEIVDNHLSVKSYAGIEDEKLTVTAQITVYPDQQPVSRNFTINTNILRANPDYYEIDAKGYSETLTRDANFIYDISLKAAETKGFSVPVKPVEDEIIYSYSAVAESGKNIPYPNVLSVGDNHNFTIAPNAPLNARATISINIIHRTKAGESVNDTEQINIPIFVASRTFTVTFEANGGSVVDDNGLNRDARELSEDSLIFENLTVSRAGYELEGWYSDEKFTNLFSTDGADALMPSKNITLYAKWRALSYTINFDANGGSVETASMTALSDVPVGELPVPTRQNYIFDGWFTDINEGTKVTPETKFAISEDITLYAHWTLNSFIVTFDANNDTEDTYELRGYCGKPLGTLPTPTRDCHIFLGWFTSPDDGKEVTAESTYATAEDITLYAHWHQISESEWIKASDVPEGAEITDEKWKYTLREYTTNGASSLSGWTKYDTKRTSWGNWSGWSTSNPSNGVRNVESRSVYDHTEYHYYRWTNGRGYVYTYQYSSAYWLEEKWFTYILPTSSSGSSLGYVGSDGGANRWVRADYSGNYSVDRTFTRSVNRTEWRYQDPIYTYYYYRDLAKEATSDPTGQSNVSNVVKYVKYRPKTITPVIQDPVQYDNHTYTLYTCDLPISWDDAKVLCEENNGHLATVTSVEENDAIKTMLASDAYAWIGGYRTDGTDAWKWITGEEFSYADWNEGEPNNTGGTENFISYHKNSKWNDFPPNTPNVYSFILETE